LKGHTTIRKRGKSVRARPKKTSRKIEKGVPHGKRKKNPSAASKPVWPKKKMEEVGNFENSRKGRRTKGDSPGHRLQRVKVRGSQRESSRKKRIIFQPGEKKAKGNRKGTRKIFLRKRIRGRRRKWEGFDNYPGHAIFNGAKPP